MVKINAVGAGGLRVANVNTSNLGSDDKADDKVVFVMPQYSQLRW